MINNTKDKIKNRATDQPLVSICCITYNHAPYIRQCLDSFLMQETDFAYEILIHDDASTDGTQDIIKEYELKYPEIIKPIYQTVNQYSQGIKISPTYNWPRAKGKYIASCEGDDYWTDPFKLNKQVKILESDPSLSACTHRHQILKNNKLTGPSSSAANERLSLEDLIWNIPFQTASIVFRKDSLHITPDIQPFILDTFLYMLLAEQGDIYFMSDIMSVYRLHDGGIWSPHSKLKKMEIREFYQNKRIDYFRQSHPKVSKGLHFRLSMDYTNTMINYARELKFKEATICLKRSLKYSKGKGQTKALAHRVSSVIKRLSQ